MINLLNEGNFILVSCEHHFTGEFENMVQHPSNNISIGAGRLANLATLSIIVDLKFRSCGVKLFQIISELSTASTPVSK